MTKKEFQLIEDCRQGRASAKAQVYKKYAPILLAICLRYINNRMEAEDVMQESFILAFDKLSQLKNTEAFEGWIKRIAVNNALKFIKNHQHLSDIDELSESYTKTENEEGSNNIKDRILESEITQEEMLAIVQKLPTGFRSVFNLYVFEKQKHSEIAATLGISIGTSKSQLLRARKLIQKNLYELVEAKEKNKKEELVMLTSFLIFMEDDLNYIDKLAHDKLNNLASNLNVNAEPVFSASTSSTLSSIGLKGKVASYIANKTIWYAIVAMGVAISVGLIAFNMDHDVDGTINNNLEQKTEIELVEKSLLKTDSAFNEGQSNAAVIAIPEQEKETIDSVKTENKKPISTVKEKDTIKKKVHVKRVVHVKRRRIVRDTIRRMDTLRTH